MPDRFNAKEPLEFWITPVKTVFTVLLTQSTGLPPALMLSTTPDPVRLLTFGL